MRPQIVEKITHELKNLLKLLINKNYSALELKTGRVRLSADEIKIAIEQYGRTPVFPPEEAFNELDLVEVLNSGPKRYSLRFDLWTKEEGRSDLTLEATVIENNGEFRWELDDIHVL